MIINKSFADQMLLLFGENYSASQLSWGNSIVFSLWSGTELSQAEMNTIRDSFTNLTTGDIANNWPTTLMTPNGRTELARLYVPLFTRRTDIVGASGMRKKFALSKVESLMTVLAAGTAGSFTLALVGNGWTGWTSAAANSSRAIFNGSVGNTESSADVKLLSTTIDLDSKIKPTDINFQFNFPSLELGW